VLNVTKYNGIYRLYKGDRIIYAGKSAVKVLYMANLAKNSSN